MKRNGRFTIRARSQSQSNEIVLQELSRIQLQFQQERCATGTDDHTEDSLKKNAEQWNKETIRSIVGM